MTWCKDSQECSHQVVIIDVNGKFDRSAIAQTIDRRIDEIFISKHYLCKYSDQVGPDDFSWKAHVYLLTSFPVCNSDGECGKLHLTPKMAEVHTPDNRGNSPGTSKRKALIIILLGLASQWKADTKLPLESSASKTLSLAEFRGSAEDGSARVLAPGASSDNVSVDSDVGCRHPQTTSIL